MPIPGELAFDADRSPTDKIELGGNALVQQAVLIQATEKLGKGKPAHVDPVQVASSPADGGHVAAAQQMAAASPSIDQTRPIRRGLHDPTGRRQATQDAKQLKYLNNEHFVERIEHDCAVGPHLEWSIAAGTILAKSLAKGWILGKAGESLGPGARVGGIGTGVVLGTMTGFYTAYETADLLENSCRAHAYQERLTQTSGGTQKDSDPGLDPFTQTYDIERGFPSVRTVVDYSKNKVDSLFGKPSHDFGSSNFERAMAHNNLSDANFISWAHKASSIPLSKQAERELTFAALGVAGGVFAAKKLHLGLQATVAMAAGGFLVGTGLNVLGLVAREDTTLAELLKDRLMSRPHDRPMP